MHSVTIGELRGVIALRDLPEEHLQWILDHSEYMEVKDGDQVVRTGEPIDYMMIMLEGALTFYLDMHGNSVFSFTFENNEETGGMGGLLPYSRMKTSIGNAFAVGNIRALRIHKKHFPELENLNPDFTQRLIAYMTDRARKFATFQLQHEKVNALGKLSAGIAHELNNPASAINRISSELQERLMLNLHLTRQLLIHCVSAEQIDRIRQLMEDLQNKGEASVKLNAIDRVEKEDEICDWLTQNDIKDPGELCETFVNAGIGIANLEFLRELSGKQAFNDVIRWFENLLSSQTIISDLGKASERISNLVSAIKSHVHMDRTQDMQRTDVITGIENTLTLLGHKLRDKQIEVERKYKDDLPEIEAHVSELNQVWMNLIDNAIFAMDQKGKLSIEVFVNNKDLKVRISDNGKGIPKEIIPRIFDPFFSTKKMGDGTGMGLDIASTIVKRHNGEIKVNSEPGKTEFTVCLPVQQTIKMMQTP